MNDKFSEVTSSPNSVISYESDGSTIQWKGKSYIPMPGSKVLPYFYTSQIILAVVVLLHLLWHLKNE